MVALVPEPLQHGGVAFASGLARFGDRVALVGDAGAITYAELADRAAAAAATLGPDPRLVALRPATTVGFVATYLGALAGGHAVLLTDNDALAAAYHAEVRYDGRLRPTGLAGPALHPDLRLLLSTSGSTGSPKLVRLSAANLDANATAIADYLGLTADDRAVTTLPLDYCYGLSVLHSHLTVGASVVLTDRSVTDPGLWRLARDHGVTSFAGVPYTFELLESTGWPDLPTLRRVTQAGGRLAPARVRALAARGRAAGWELFVMYGQTEATARMAYLPPRLAAQHPGAIGIPIPGGSIRLDPVAEAGPGVGEIVYAGPNVMMGYATGTADLARGPELTELRTGDLARRNAAGLLEIVGRRSRFAKLFGQRIDLDRTAALLSVDGYDAACAEACDDSQQLVVALGGTTDPTDVDACADAATRATGLPAHAVRVVPLTGLPRLANGKPDHAAVARLTAADRPADLPRSPIESVTAQFAAVLGRDDVGPDDTFTGLGGDSLSYVELAVRLESRLHRLPAEWPTSTVRELAALHVAGRRPRWRWVRLDTSILIRAIAIVLIVGTHTNLFTVAGGAHVLLGVAGYNFARFLLNGSDPAARRRAVLRAAARIAVPTAVWTALVALVLGTYGWRNVLLLNDALGSHRWQEPAWHFWFLEVLIYCSVAIGLLLATPPVLRLERRAPYWLPVALLLPLLALRFWAKESGYDGDVIHSSVFIAWLFVGGWAAARTTATSQRLLVSALLLLGVHDLFTSELRDAVVAVGLLAMVWLRSVPWPRLLVGATGVLASSSLYVYLTHWQVYPHLEHRWPLGGLLASLAVGVAVWYVVDRTSAALRRRRSTALYPPTHLEETKEPV